MAGKIIWEMKCKTEGCETVFTCPRPASLRTSQVRTDCPKCGENHLYNKDGSYPAVWLWKPKPDAMLDTIVWEMICKTKGCGKLFTYDRPRSLQTNQVRPECPHCGKIGFYNKDGTPWAVWEYRPKGN